MIGRQSDVIRLNLKKDIMVVFMQPASLCISFTVLDTTHPPSEIFTLSVG